MRSVVRNALAGKRDRDGATPARPRARAACSTWPGLRRPGRWARGWRLTPSPAAAAAPTGCWSTTSTYRVLVNHRTGQLLELSEGEAGICRQLDTGRVPDARRGPAAAPVRDPQRRHHRHQPASLHRPGRSWLLADAAGVPDLTRRSHGAITRLLIHLTTRNPLTPADRALAAYSAANGLAAAALLATAGFFWYQLFGDLAATLTRHGPAGWALLIAAAIQKSAARVCPRKRRPNMLSS
jgi:hypothetical protein